MAREEMRNQMIAYKRTVTIKNPRELILNDLPFEAGQRVEVVLLAEGAPSDDTLTELQRLLQDTQAVPPSRAITDEEILAEIEAWRAESREGRH